METTEQNTSNKTLDEILIQYSRSGLAMRYSIVAAVTLLVLGFAFTILPTDKIDHAVGNKNKVIDAAFSASDTTGFMLIVKGEKNVFIETRDGGITFSTDLVLPDSVKLLPHMPDRLSNYLIEYSRRGAENGNQSTTDAIPDTTTTHYRPPNPQAPPAYTDQPPNDQISGADTKKKDD